MTRWKSDCMVCIPFRSPLTLHSLVSLYLISMIWIAGVSVCDATNAKDNRVISLENNSDNLKVLSTILHVMKDIGPLDSFVAPSPRETVLLEQILENVSLCIDGFLSTKAYQKERELTVAPASTLIAEKTMRRINQNGMFRGFPVVYFVHGGKYLVESLFDDFEVVQEDVDLMIPSLQEYKVLMQNAYNRMS